MDEPIKTTICPMQPPALYNPEDGKTVYFKCEGEECQWWDKKHECCAVVTIAGAILNLDKNGWKR